MPEGSPWATSILSDESREAFYKAALSRLESRQMDAHKVRELGFLVGAAGLIFGLVGLGVATAVFLKTPVPEPPGYIFVDRTTGVVDQPVAARDAPRYFPATVRERAIRDFIVECESYMPETWARIDYHGCMIQATPAEQKRRAEEIGRNGPRYPPLVFGPGGWAMPTSFLAFTLLGQAGTEPNQTYRYQVRYERAEVSGGKETRQRYTADLTLQFHPELKISAADRLLNPFGLQVVSFSTIKD